MSTIAMIAVFGGMLGGVVSFLGCLVVTDLLARWSQRPTKEDPQDLMSCLKPEPTPLMNVQYASFGSPPHNYTKKKLLPEGEDPWKWDLQYDENGKPYLTERCRAE